MAQPTMPSPALLVLAAFSRHEAAVQWARDRAVGCWGPLAMVSPLFDFKETDYYESTMGTPLRKIFFTFKRPFDPAEIAAVKLRTNRLEEEYAESAGHAEPRPLNLDPGYVTLGKLVLASAKDYAHRIYLSRGIHAEITLSWRHGRWQPHEWTFADYRRSDYQQFFSQCRELLHQRLRKKETT